jgi:hypothetical protein
MYSKSGETKFTVKHRVTVLPAVRVMGFTAVTDEPVMFSCASAGMARPTMSARTPTPRAERFLRNISDISLLLPTSNSSVASSIHARIKDKISNCHSAREAPFRTLEHLVF